MKRLLAMVCGATALVALAARAENWCQRFADDNVLLGYVNVKGVRAIPEVNAVLDGQDRLSRLANRARKQMSVDFETVTEVWFGVSPATGPIAVLRGDFNLVTIRGAVGASANLRVSTPPGVEFVVAYTRPNKGTMVAFLSPQEIVVGKAAQVEAFLDNLASGKRHARQQDLSGLEAPQRLVECVLLGLPKEVQKLPAGLAEHLGLLTLTVTGQTSAELVLTVQPRNPEMVAPLATWCQSSLALLRLLPPEQLASLGPVRKALLASAEATAIPPGVALSASLPLATVHDLLATALATGRPVQPQPTPKAAPQPAPAPQP